MSKITVEHLLAHFADSQAGKKIISETAAAALKEREPKIAQIARIRAEAEKEAPALRAALDAAVEQEKHARVAY